MVTWCCCSHRRSHCCDSQPGDTYSFQDGTLHSITVSAAVLAHHLLNFRAIGAATVEPSHSLNAGKRAQGCRLPMN
jgi:hypothetical protein